MKKYILIIAIFGIICSFVKNKPCTKAQRINTPPVTTLDSLQGTWLSSKDTSYKIQIIGHIKYEFYANQCTDTLNFFLDTNCTDTAIANYNMTKTDGNHLIVYANGYPSYEFCYEIGYLSDNSLEFYYDGKHISFSKQ